MALSNQTARIRFHTVDDLRQARLLPRPPMETTSNQTTCPPGQNPSNRSKRRALACFNCRKRKIKCVLQDTIDCSNCRNSEIECIWVDSQRGKWSRAAKRAAAANSIGQVSPAIQQCHTQSPGESRNSVSTASTANEETNSVSKALPPDDTTENVVDVESPLHYKLDNAIFPLGVLAEANRQIQNSPHDQSEDDTLSPSTSGATQGSTQMLGIANACYFRGDFGQKLVTKVPDNTKPKSHFAQGLISISQAHELFEIYFDHLNPQIGLLDRTMLTPQLAHSRSRLLFLAICTVAARFYKGGILYNALVQQSHQVAKDSMLSSRSTATVQGFIILATWVQQSVSYENCYAYMYAGIAIRIGMEIGLHRRTVLRYPETMNAELKRAYTEELRVRERTWICCFILDRGVSVQTGKPCQVPETSSIDDAEDWCLQAGSRLSDVFISSYAKLLQTLYRCLDIICSNKKDSKEPSSSFHDQIAIRDLNRSLEDWTAKWEKILRSHHHEHNEGSLELYLSYLRFLRAFYNLIPLSFRLHQGAIDNLSKAEQLSFITRCYEFAVNAIKTAIEELGPNIFKFTTDSHVIAIGYLACFLLKLMGPKFKHIFNDDFVHEILIEVANILAAAAEDENHIPQLYSIFIRKQILLHRKAKTHTAPNTTTQSPNQVQNSDVAVSSDGSINIVSACGGTEIFHPLLQDMDLDSVLGRQHQYQDQFWVAFSRGFIGIMILIDCWIWIFEGGRIC